MTRRQKMLPGIVLLMQVVLGVAAWRDLARRTEEQVRGRKSLWRASVLLNPGNALLYWLCGRRGAPPGVADAKAHRVDVPEQVLVVDTLPDPSYTCAFQMNAPRTTARSPEVWLRAVMEDGPPPLRWFILAGWTAALRLRLGPLSSTDHVLGWKILSASPTEIVIGVAGTMLSAHQVLQVQDARVVHSTIVHYHRPAARVLWAAAASIHVRVIPHLMEHARRAPSTVPPSQ